jgi:hypothetical protein
MARHRDFGSPVLSSDEPLTFTLYGEVFRCQPALQGRVLIEFIAQSSADDPASGARAVLQFFNAAIVDADHDRFKTMTESSEHIVTMDTLTEIMDWLVEQYTGRPTEQPSPSQPGESTTGTMPVAVPSSPQEPVSVS